MCDVRRKRSGSGFTLIELLVVVAIIATLIAILMPALKNARQSALAVQCASKMRQVCSAALIYASDNSGVLPPASVSATPTYPAYPSGIGGASWFHFLQQNLTPFISGQSYLPGTKGVTVARCPCNPFPATSDSTPNFAWNYRLNQGSPVNLWMKASSINRPSEILLVFDQNENPYLTAKRAVAYFGPGDNYVGNGNYFDTTVRPTWHNEGGNYGFVDGHVSRHQPAEVTDRWFRWWLQ